MEKKELVPRLRFPDFLNHRAPIVELSKLAKYVTDTVPLAQVNPASYVSTESLLPEFRGFDKPAGLPTVTSVRGFKRNDVLVSNIRPYLKKVWHADRDGGASNDVLVLRASGAVRPNYLAQIIRSERFIGHMMKSAKGVKMPRGDAEDALTFKVMSPSDAEQQQIAECLQSLDQLIAAETEKLEAQKRHKKGLLQRLFPAEGETIPPLRFPEFRGAGEWRKLSLAELIGSLDAGVSVNSIDRPAVSNEIGVLKTSAVTNGIFVSEENKVILDEIEKGRVKEPVTKDTIILSRMNTPLLVGANAYVKASQQNLFLPDRLWAVKCKPGVSTRFLAIMLGSDRGRKDLADLAKGSSGSMKNIAKTDVLTLSIMAPLQAEQHRIAECIAYVEDLVDSQMQGLRILKGHKAALMEQLFPSLDEI